MGAKEGLRKNPEESGPRMEAALMAVFPNPDSYASFVSEDRGDPAPFVRLAREHGLILKNGDEKALTAFIRHHARVPHECTPPAGMSLSALLEDREKIRLSVRGLTGWINRLVAEFGLQAMMPSGKVSNAMFSRLARGPANTPSKRNALRLLGFWFGYKRPELGKAMNYETLRRLCGTDQMVGAREGARLGFLLHSRGHVIEEKTVKWLKDEVRNCVRDLGLRRVARMRAYHTTSFYLDLPVENDSGSGPASSKALSRRVRDALAIAHQMAVRWSLAEVSSQRRIMTIGITAGEFDMLDEYLQAILNAKITGDPIIRMTESARQCVLMNDIRAVFCRKPKAIELFNAEPLNVWWLNELWNTNFWDFVPVVLRDRLLHPAGPSAETLRKVIWYPEEIRNLGELESESRVSRALINTPDNSLVGLEIARTLYFRRRFFEANHILQSILSADAHHISARTLRLCIMRNLAADERLPFSVSEMYFEHGDFDAGFLEELGSELHEDCICEQAFNQLARARRVLRLVRQDRTEGFESAEKVNVQRVVDLLHAAESSFKKAMALSPTGHRGAYGLIMSKSLRRMLTETGEALCPPSGLVLDRGGICRTVAAEVFIFLGYLRIGTDKANELDAFFGRLQKEMTNYYESVLLRTVEPNIKFALAAVLWDFGPVMSIGLTKTVLSLLGEAISMAGDLKADALCVASDTRLSFEILPVDEFVADLHAAIGAIQERVGTLEELGRRRDEEILSDEEIGGLKLFCMHI